MFGHRFDSGRLHESHRDAARPVTVPIKTSAADSSPKRPPWLPAGSRVIILNFIDLALVKTKINLLRFKIVNGHILAIYGQ